MRESRRNAESLPLWVFLHCPRKRSFDRTNSVDLLKKSAFFVRSIRLSHEMGWTCTNGPSTQITVDQENEINRLALRLPRP